MQKELVEKLQRACPQAWSDLGADPAVSNMAFGVVIGVGWHELLLNLSVMIQIELNSHPEPRFKFTAVKEKFGLLNITHKGSTNDSIYEMIDAAQDESVIVCEYCSSREEVQIRDLGGEILQTMCEWCWAECQLPLP